MNEKMNKKNNLKGRRKIDFHLSFAFPLSRCRRKAMNMAGGILRNCYRKANFKIEFNSEEFKSKTVIIKQ